MTEDRQSSEKDQASTPTKRRRAKWAILIALLAIPVGLVIAFVAVSYVKAYGQPYSRDIDPALIPVYTKANLPFTHKYDSSSLPTMGSCVFDIDGDGVSELYLGGGKDQPDALFRYTDKGFEPIADAAGITKTLPDATYGAATTDVDHDGDPDLFVARDSGVTLYINDKGTFTGKKLDIPFDDKSTPLSFALGDLNGDGFVDMYVAAYLPRAKIEGLNIFNKENYGANSLILVNNGDNTFRDITDESGMRYTHNTFQGVFVDLDEDRQLDLVVAHDTGQVKTWKNMGGLKFEDRPNPTTDVYGYPMGIAVGDYNNDGRADLFFSNTGGTAPHFLAKGDLRPDQKFDDKLIFFRNDGDFKFTNVNKETQTADFEFSWGTVFHDLNLDGRQDLIISQNFIDLPLHKLFKLPGRVLIQRPDETFASTEDRSGVVNRNYEITSLVADFNNDGYPDMVRVNLAGPALAFIHNGGDNHYLKVRLPDVPSSLGAKVSLTTESGKVLTDWLVAGEGLECDQEHVLTFGLGEEAACKKLDVQYMDGRQVTIEQPKIDSLVVVGNENEAKAVSGDQP